MFNTIEPNPEKSKRDRIVEELGNTVPIFESRADFAKWLDEQLEKLESSHKGFFTSQSMRSFFNRN